MDLEGLEVGSLWALNGRSTAKLHKPPETPQKGRQIRLIPTKNCVPHTLIVPTVSQHLEKVKTL